MLSAFATDLGAVVGDLVVEPDQNEIVAAMALIKELPLDGAVITGDAIFCQRELCRHIRDANGHLANASTSYDYIQSDNTHPTYSGATIYIGLIGGSGSGSGAPEYSGGQIVGGKNPIWNQFGHERMGWAISAFNPATP